MKKLPNSCFLNILFGVIIVAAFTVKIYSQSAAHSEEDTGDANMLKTVKRLPILNNFRFIPSDIINNPFITSYIKTSVGAGTAINLKSYLEDLDGNPLGSLSGSLSFITADILFQTAINDWLAFNVKYGGIARVGTNAYTILTSGISYATGYSLGAKIKIWGNDKMMVSGGLDYNSSRVFLYSIYEFVKKVIDSGKIDESARDEIPEYDNIVITFINLYYAFAPTDWCGLLGVAGWGVGNPFNEKDKGNARVGLAATLDFDNIKHVGFPIGVLVSLKYNSFAEGGENSNDVLTYGLKIGYTGHKDFDVGIENTYSSLNYQLSDEKVNTLLTALKIRYYF